jgi:hypothetical protein
MSILNLPNIQSVRLIGADLCCEKSTNLPASANLPQQNYSGRWQHEKEGTTGETSSTKFTSNK